MRHEAAASVAAGVAGVADGVAAAVMTAVAARRVAGGDTGSSVAAVAAGGAGVPGRAAGLNIENIFCVMLLCRRLRAAAAFLHASESCCVLMLTVSPEQFRFFDRF